MKIVFYKLLFLFFVNIIHNKVIMNDMQKNYFKQIGLERKLSNLPEPPKARKLPQQVIFIKKPSEDNDAQKQIPLTDNFLQTIEDEINKQDNIQKDQQIHDQDIEEFLEQKMKEIDQHRQNLNSFDEHHRDMFQDHSNEQYDEIAQDHHHSKEEQYENILNLINQSEDKLQGLNLQSRKRVKEHHDHSVVKRKHQKKPSSSSIQSDTSEIDTSEEQNLPQNAAKTDLFLDHLIRDNQQGQNQMMSTLQKLNEKFDQVIGLVKDIRDKGVGHGSAEEQEKQNAQKNNKIDIHIEEINKIFQNLHEDEIKFQKETGLGWREFSQKEKTIIKDILQLIENLPQDVRDKIVIPEQYEQMLHQTQRQEIKQESEHESSQEQIKESKQDGLHIPGNLMQDLSEFIQHFTQEQKFEESHEGQQHPFTGDKQINYDDMIPLLSKGEKFDPHFTDLQNLPLEELEKRREELVRQYLKDHPDFDFNHVSDQNHEQSLQRDKDQQVDHEEDLIKVMSHHTVQTHPVISKYQSNLNHMQNVQHKPQNSQEEQTHDLVHDNVVEHNDHPESANSQTLQNNQVQIQDKSEESHEQTTQNIQKQSNNSQNSEAQKKQQVDNQNQTHDLVHDNIIEHNDHPESVNLQNQQHMDQLQNPDLHNSEQVENQTSSQAQQTPKLDNDKTDELVYDNIVAHQDHPESHQVQNDQIQVDQSQTQNAQQPEVLQNQIQDNIQQHSNEVTHQQPQEVVQNDNLNKQDLELQNALNSDQHYTEEQSVEGHNDQQPNGTNKNEPQVIDDQVSIQNQIQNLNNEGEIQLAQNGELTEDQKEQALENLVRANTNPEEKKDWEKDEQMANQGNIKVDMKKRRKILL